MSYQQDEPKSNFGLYFILIFLAICMIGAGIFFTQCSPKKDPTDQTETTPQKTTTDTTQDPLAPDPDDPTAQPETNTDPFSGEPTTQPITDPAEILTNLGPGAADLDPKSLLQNIANSLQAGELQKAATLIGKDALNQNHLNGLKALSDSNQLKIHPVNPISEIGELEANRRARWSLNLADENTTRIYFDLARSATGKWSVEKLTIPPKPQEGEKPSRAVFVDSLGITDSFLHAALDQNFDDAKSFVDSTKVSDAKIAGLCIIFEEAKYQLRSEKPLRAMFNRDTTAAFKANVQDETGERAAEFGINLQRADATQPWRITEINLDQLLADYATRLAGGDVHFTPLVKNPAGGDSLILYFGFDENQLTPRTARQLDIVASLLKLDPNKKLTLSGHTDALGSDDYNTNLSKKRAEAVKQYLLTVGVSPAQMVTLAEGEAKPRRPNTTEQGEDNPTGRRANRRTEIYLDF